MTTANTVDWDVFSAIANNQRLYDSMTEFPELRDKYLPDYIVGDFDSIRPEVMQYYTDKKCTLKHEPDQDHHDLDKCLALLASAFSDSPPSEVTVKPIVYVLGSMGGRFDHTMASIGVLFKSHVTDALRPILISAMSAAWILHPGLTHVIKHNGGSATSTEHAPLKEGPTCGLLPIGSPCASVTTTGLKWNVTDARLEFGGLVR